MRTEETKREISDPYLTAFLFLNLKQKPSPIIDRSGRVSFQFPDDEKTDEIIKRYHEDEQISVFSFATAIKAVKSMIFSLKGKANGAM